MRLVVDTNRIVAGLIKNGGTRAILLSPIIKLLAPEKTIQEIEKHSELIMEKAGLSREKYSRAMRVITEGITIIPKENVKQHLEEAKEIIGSIDPDDVPFIATALATKNEGIWTEDKHFKNQNKIKIWTTEELLTRIERIEGPEKR